MAMGEAIDPTVMVMVAGILCGAIVALVVAVASAPNDPDE